MNKKIDLNWFDDFSENIADFVDDVLENFDKFSLNIEKYKHDDFVYYFNTYVYKSLSVETSIKRYSKVLDLFFNYISYQYIDINYINNNLNEHEHNNYYQLSMLCSCSKQPDSLELNYIEKFSILKPYLIKLFLFDVIKHLDFDNNFLSDTDFLDINAKYKVLEIVFKTNNVHVQNLINFLKQNKDKFLFNFDDDINNINHNIYLTIAAK